MAALGGRGVVAEAPAEGGLELSLTSDALVVRTTSEAVRGSDGNLEASEADVTRLQSGPRRDVARSRDGGRRDVGADAGGGGAP